MFALPFAIQGAFLAASAQETEISRGRFTLQPGRIFLAMVLARIEVMLAIRVLDAGLDSGNPRSSGRAIPPGRLSRREGIFPWIIVFCLFLVMYARFGLFFANWGPL